MQPMHLTCINNVRKRVEMMKGRYHVTSRHHRGHATVGTVATLQSYISNSSYFSSLVNSKASTALHGDIREIRTGASIEYDCGSKSASN